jgi:hypothetical protein
VICAMIMALNLLNLLVSGGVGRRMAPGWRGSRRAPMAADLCCCGGQRISNPQVEEVVSDG